jgi:hypothetical protein
VSDLTLEMFKEGLEAIRKMPPRVMVPLVNSKGEPWGYTSIPYLGWKVE